MVENLRPTLGSRTIEGPNGIRFLTKKAPSVAASSPHGDPEGPSPEPARGSRDPKGGRPTKTYERLLKGCRKTAKIAQNDARTTANLATNSKRPEK